MRPYDWQVDGDGNDLPYRDRLTHAGGYVLAAWCVVCLVLIIVWVIRG